MNTVFMIMGNNLLENNIVKQHKREIKLSLVWYLEEKYSFMLQAQYIIKETFSVQKGHYIPPWGFVLENSALSATLQRNDKTT